MLSLSQPKEQDGAIRSFTVQGVDYEIDWSFDNVLRWMNMTESSLSQVEKAGRTFDMFIGAVPGVTVEDVIRLFSFISKEVSKSPYGNSLQSEDVKPVGKYNRSFDYETDAEAVYASFMADYGIDLMEEKGKMSWFKFKALLDNLSPKSPLKRIAQIRQTNPTIYKDDPKALEALLHDQEYYSLAQTEEQQREKVQEQIDDAVSQL